ncbi:hypothetical protein A2225_03155 [Candidatus Nomurabacteria bacterium RIFOXYA2_FULL_42_12]|uniref:Uncharacterized protein n=1 Tax=Candidatus Nomurabacteria bacterium RIFOXYA2_FULL_42_12 TaxID=1801801 RepID=A0A1F6YKW7_9BACT|nr:MAG: hypothetical protein A2225_03155 [Candidatus Nomurabacteria bacterium RIFOXYA2_FULL_42_12]
MENPKNTEGPNEALERIIRPFFDGRTKNKKNISFWRAGTNPALPARPYRQVTVTCEGGATPPFAHCESVHSQGSRTSGATHPIPEGMGTSPVSGPMSGPKRLTGGACGAR